MATSRTKALPPTDEVLLRILSAMLALVFVMYGVLVSGSDPLYTIPALAMLDCGVRMACRVVLH